ncbi:MAG: CatB-related O-acetyltransferase [Actinomyces succiniciruminis]|nr:CatB-related O-acetyltransferase [Actinomyces succiniciruminis]
MREMILGSPELEAFLDERAVFLDVAKGWGGSAARRIEFDSGVRVEGYTGFYGGGPIVNMGAFSYSQSPLTLGMIIGRYCSIGSGLTVQKTVPRSGAFSTSNLAYERGGPVMRRAATLTSLPDADSSYRVVHRAPIIGHDVWIGMNAFLGRGVKVGIGAVVRDCSVVLDDVPPYAIVEGNPANIVGFRFSADVIERLLATRWWKRPLDQVVRVLTSDVASAIEDMEGRHPGVLAVPVVTGDDLIAFSR